MVIVILVAGVLAASAVTAGSLDGFALRWYAISGGGGRSSSAGYVLQGSAGQPAVGALGGASYRLASGFWAGAVGASAVATATATRTTAAATATATPTRTPAPSPTATLNVRSRRYLPVVLKVLQR